ncbi:VOC family protein [Anatilimnocola sp. NA78]|uniref:VOC family protein n=1 Tax=Anatilimnocola sp. NA78 TaxID=3415683 RepID=UPI003CE4AE35
MKTTLRGIFLTSEKPERTAAFYRDVALLELEQVGSSATYLYWKVDRDGVQIAIHDAAKFASYTHPVQYGSNATHLYFKIEDQAPFLQHLDALGISPVACDDVVVTVDDPDGRKVMFGTA